MLLAKALHHRGYAAPANSKSGRIALTTGARFDAAPVSTNRNLQHLLRPISVFQPETRGPCHAGPMAPTSLACETVAEYKTQLPVPSPSSDVFSSNNH